MEEAEEKVANNNAIARVYDNRGTWPVMLLSSIMTMKEVSERKLRDSQDIIEALQKENALLKKQVRKINIYKFLEGITDHEISAKTLVDIQLQGDAIMIGRPNVEGSSKKQMRHTTPYSFIKSLIKSQTQEQESASALYINLKDLIPTLIHEKTGICLQNTKIEDIKTCLRKHSLINEHYKTLTTSRNSEKIQYILIQIDDLVPTWKKKLSSTLEYDEKAIEKSEQLYHEKRLKYIQHGLNLIAENISPYDDNTYNVTCEALTRLILTLFNERSLAAFPDEGNSYNYEIRLYKTLASAEAAAKKDNEDYEIINTDKIKNLQQDGKDLNLMIRIVKNEGDIIKKSIAIFKLLNDTLKNVCTYKQLEEQAKLNDKQEEEKQFLQLTIEKDIKNYDSLNLFFEKRLSTPIIIEEKDSTIDDSFFKQQLNFLDCRYPADIANILYLIFDFKPLEKVVFAPSNSKDEIKVYPSSKELKIATYELQLGDKYREAQIESIKDGDYNKKARFRTKITFDEEINILADKIIEHLTIALSAFEYFREGSILIKDKFAKQVKKDYKANYSLEQTEQFDKLFDEYFNNATIKVTGIGFFENSDDVKSSGSVPLDIDQDF